MVRSVVITSTRVLCLIIAVCVLFIECLLFFSVERNNDPIIDVSLLTNVIVVPPKEYGGTSHNITGAIYRDTMDNGISLGSTIGCNFINSEELADAVMKANPNVPKWLTIVIPFRHRTKHLKQIMEFFSFYFPKYASGTPVHVIVVDQGDENYFNRGFLFNVGLKEAICSEGSQHIDCVVLHDVDRFPDVRAPYPVEYRNCRSPIQLNSENDEWGNKVLYDEYTGGVVSMSAKHWAKVNGMSNQYKGWGGEDDDLYWRLRSNGLLHELEKNKFVIRRPPKGHGRFTSMKGNGHVRGKQNPKIYKANVKRLKAMKLGSNSWKTDGFRDVVYKVSNKVVDSLSWAASNISLTSITVYGSQQPLEIDREVHSISLDV